MGGNNKEYGTGIVIDTDSNMYITGYTFSPDYPVTFDALDITQSNEEVILSRLSSDFATLVFSTYIGGGIIDIANCIAIDNDRMIYIGGGTTSGDFPLTAGSYSPDGRMFISKITLGPFDTPTPTPTSTPTITPVHCSMKISTSMLILLIITLLMLQFNMVSHRLYRVRLQNCFSDQKVL
ncbi:MAG: hypothetical protein A2161_14095 [Candidatus Schekmanbacteria bacterium RBG_13_48_7]|uniref:Beta-propeller repeat protein n=1 Tax=Candidatus Schekmanbacteria bacterium RBG_13_48_7 TaxID=1817878 RepID=A0A1F7RZZ3_9BACT|nr:MAG: hypothetical protein A2161_14095 [Candidatus Schekmanbacteria bacterium RBG_13_48_7]